VGLLEVWPDPGVLLVETGDVMFLTAIAAKMADPRDQGRQRDEESSCLQALVLAAATAPYVDLTKPGKADGQTDNHE